MLCEDCKKRPACVHITQIVNNQKKESHLCEECAKAAGEVSFSIDNQFSVHDFLKGMFNHVFLNDAQEADEFSCKECGMTYSDFNRKGKFGCSGCYAIFGQKLEPLFKRVHGASIHTGKIPKRAGGRLEIRQRIKNMRRELDSYVASEEYEKAAKVRDAIRLLESELSTEPKGEE